jgi:hypothetical protein
MKNPPDAFIERVSSKEEARRFREPRGPDHSKAGNRSNTGKTPLAAGKMAGARNIDASKTLANGTSVCQFTFRLCGCFPVLDRQ